MDIHVAMGVIVNPSHISQVCLLGVDYTTVIVTAKYESYSDIPTCLRLKKEENSYFITDVCHVRCWGVGPDSLSGDLSSSSGVGPGPGGLPPHVLGVGGAPGPLASRAAWHLPTPPSRPRVVRGLTKMKKNSLRRCRIAPLVRHHPGC
ncbi:hypothetical protein SEVIR_2G026950v4 [Setaria viridis]